MRAPIDFGILTVREDELEAVLTFLPSNGMYRGRRLYNLATVETVEGDAYEVAVVRSLEAGSGEAIEVARDLIEELSPQWLLVVGIAGGVPGSGVWLGDVVVSSRIVDFTAETVQPDGERTYVVGGGPIAPEAAMVVANLPAVKSALGAWNDVPIGEAHPPREKRPKVTAGVVASSDRVIKDPALLEQWNRHVRGIKAVEMESAGIYRVASTRHVPFLAIRGIADVIGEKRTADATRHAGRTAASFTAAFLRTRPIAPRPAPRAAPAGFSPLAEAPISPRPGAPFHVSKVTLTDVRGFDALEIPLARPAEDAGQWLILLGANGVGKTSILRALALALSSDEVVQGLLGRLGKSAPMVRLRATKATIQIECPSGFLPRAVLAAGETGDRLDARGGGEVAAPFTVAYGCRRGSALGGAAREVNVLSPLSAVETLFDEGAGLVHAETWLRERKLAATLGAGLKEEAFFDAVLATLVELLPGVSAIHVGAEAIDIEGPNVGRIPLGALSDGYLTTAGWVLDLLARWAEDAKRRGTPLDGSFREQMTGVAIIDEIDLHLHPQWQREVISGVRRLFPKMSFVVTTHNPLSLLGANPGEIHVLRRDRDTGRVALEQRDLPLGAGAERILTGEWFDLESTLDDDTLALLEQHRRLLREGSADAPAAKKIEAELSTRLGSYGATSIERLAQSAAAQVIREDTGTLTPEDRRSARTKIAALLRKASAPAKKAPRAKQKAR